MTLLKRIVLVFTLIISFSTIASAETILIKKIKVNGLHRISLGTVLSYIQPIKEGDRIDSSDTSYIIRQLYKTRFFSDVKVTHRNETLIINVVERSVIGSLTTQGNKKITKKQLLEALKSVGIAEGQALDQAILSSMKEAIQQQYYNFGYYAVRVNVDVKKLDRNRVAVIINVQEGPASKIKSIKIIGNKNFSQRKILKEFSLTTTKLWSFLTNSDQYSKEKFDADLERLKTFYMDRGYLGITVDSTKVSITPDKKGIYIVIKITEGPVYRLGNIKVDGNLIGKRQEILKLMTLKSGDIFSLKDIMDVQREIISFLGDYGYGMPDIKAEKQIDKKTKIVNIKFVITPGYRLYIRRINFSGNIKTNDEVLRREMRLQEGGSLILSKVDESTRRLYNLGYLEDINHKITPVADTNNQVDLDYNVKETSAITANFQAGYSNRDSFLYGMSLNDQNLFGTGKTAFIRFDNTKASQYYGLGYRDPYLTTSQIGMSINAYMSKFNPSKIDSDISSYRKNKYGTFLTFDFPLSDYTHTNFGLGVEHTSIVPSSKPNSRFERFLNKHGTNFNQMKFSAGISYNDVDRAIFPTKGFSQSLGADLYAPFNNNGLRYYTLNHTTSWYQPLFKNFIFHTASHLGYGDGIFGTGEYPPFENFFAGGIGTVRGFSPDSIAPKNDKNNTIGGNVLTTATASIIFPTPVDAVRASVFIDVGNVYQEKFKVEDLRASCGVQFEWRTPIAPLVFSFAKPIRKKSWDESDLFQFTISTSI